MLYRSLFLISVLIVTSCIDQKDYTLDTLTVTPTLAVPIAFGDISILDFASDTDSAYFRTYPDGLLYFSYTQTLDARQIRALFDLPANNSTPVSFDLPAGSLPPSSSDVQYSSINKVVDFNFDPGQLTEMLLKGTSAIKYTISTSQATSPALPLDVNLTLTDAVEQTTHLPFTFTATTGTGSKSLNGYLIQMTDNKFNIKLNLVLKKRSSAVFVPANTKLNVNLSFVTDFAYIKGFFGDQQVSLPTQTIDLTIFSSELEKSKISFTDPVLKLAVRNDNGVPSEINFSSIYAKKGNSQVPFQLNPANPINLSYPTVLGKYATTDIAVTNGTNLIALPPNQLTYSATARINKGLTSGTNFMADTSRLHVSVITELPLHGHVSGYTISDTLKIDLGKIDKSTIISSALRVKAVNQMPMDANIQLYLADENYHVIDSLFSSGQTLFVKSSVVNGSGDFVSSGVNDFKFDLLPEKVDKIFTSKYLLVKSRLNTTKDPNGGYLNVKFKSTYKLKLNVGLLAKVNITATK
ncbi:hypothetical protein BH10BAC4_BH10BAC4_04570 [soil metagenome]